MSEEVNKKVSEKVESHETRVKALKIIKRFVGKATSYQGKVVKALMEQLGMKYALAYYYVTVVGAEKGFVFEKRAPKVEKTLKAGVKKHGVAPTVTPVDVPATGDTYVNGLDPHPVAQEEVPF